MKTRRILVTATMAMFPLAANADFLSITAGGGFWNESPSGNFQSTSDPLPVEVDNQLFWDGKNQYYFFAALEHPVPVIPNVRLSYVKLEHSGNGSAGFVFDGVSYSGTINSDVSIAETSALLYWEVLDNVVSVDVGLDLRLYDINYSVDSAGTSTKDSLKASVPLAYGMVGFSPMPGLLFAGEVSALSLGGSGVVNYSLKASYTTDFHVGVEGGYRSESITFDDISGYDADITFDGIFGGLYVKF